MTKAIAIFFLTLFLFNLIGYRGWLYYQQQKEKSSLEATLDKEDYDEKDLITFKVPLSMPYQNSWSDFERVDGEVTIDGTIYKYVKRKVEDGQLILMCLPNYKKMSLLKAAAEFGSHNDDPAATGKRGRASTNKNTTPNEYEENTRFGLAGQAGSLITPARSFYLFSLTSCCMEFPGQPPELG